MRLSGVGGRLPDRGFVRLTVQGDLNCACSGAARPSSGIATGVGRPDAPQG
jgi:hypothetical protein